MFLPLLRMKRRRPIRRMTQELKMLLWSAMRTHPSLLPVVGFQPVKCYMEGGRRLVRAFKGVLFIFEGFTPC